MAYRGVRKLDKVYGNMYRRCYNTSAKDYKYYGARGINICDSWLLNKQSFIDWAMVNGWEETLKIDRIDNDGSYNPTNCRFVTHQEQMLNRRYCPRPEGKYGRYITYRKNKKLYRLYNKKLAVEKHFKTLEEAVKFRDSLLSDIKNRNRMWGSTWDEVYGTQLEKIGGEIANNYNRITGKHLMWKTKYGSIRYELIGCVGVVTEEEGKILHDCIEKAVEKFPHLKEEILEDSPFEDQNGPYWDRVT